MSSLKVFHEPLTDLEKIDIYGKPSGKSTFDVREEFESVGIALA